MKTSVCVIVLNWNGWEDRQSSVSSLETLDYPNYEAIVADDDSIDRSEAKIREAYSGVEVLRRAGNPGFADGNNEGIEY